MTGIKNIEAVDIIYLREQTLKKVDHEFKDQYNTRVPFSFFINGDWRVQHKCCNCNEVVVTGADEPVTNEQHNFNRLPYLREKFFKPDVLKELSGLFSQVLLIRTDEYRVVHKNYNKDFPVPVELFQYACENCKICYLAHYARGYGSGGEKGELSTPDIIYIHEIIGLQMDQIIYKH